MIMYNESWFYNRRVRPVLSVMPGLKAYERVELRTGKGGMPDIIYSMNGTGFIELKWNDSDNIIDLSGWTKGQRDYAVDYDRCLLLVGTKYKTTMLDPRKVVDRIGRKGRSLAYSSECEGCAIAMWSDYIPTAHLRGVMYWVGHDLPDTRSYGSVLWDVTLRKLAPNDTKP